MTDRRAPDAAAAGPTLIRATPDDLPPAVAAALRNASPDLGEARRATVEAAGIPWATYAWGDPRDPTVILAHGVTSNAEAFWRVAPAIATNGRHVVAIDLPGHGRTGHWNGRHLFHETAADLAACLRTMDLERLRPTILGHSWGAMVAAALPAAGLLPGRLLLLDPPALPASAMELMTHDPVERQYDHLAEAEAAIRAASPGWTAGDIRAKALGLTQFDAEAVLAVLVENGDWDGGLSALGDPSAAGVPVWLIRGEFEAGGMIPDAVVPAFEARIGADHILTIAGAPHSPQRLFPEATVSAILRALR